jgi:RNA-directed DNA polymerase
LLTDGEGNTRGGDNRELPIDLTESKTLRMRGHSMHENREVPRTPECEGPAGRPEKGSSPTSGMYVRGKSDRPIVPMKSPNKGDSGVREASAEGAEGRGLAKGNTRQTATPSFHELYATVLASHNRFVQRGSPAMLGWSRVPSLP